MDQRRQFPTLIRKIRKQKVLLLFLLPAMVLVILFNYIPMTGVVMAFQKFVLGKGFWGSEWIGLDNFRRFLASPEFWRAMRNTVAINGIGIVFGFPMPILFALFLNEIVSLKYKKTVQTITYFPHFISWVVVAGLFYKLLDANSGAINLLLSALGFDKVPFLRMPQIFWPLIVLVTIWKELGWNSIIYLSVLSGIDPCQYEAARIDGAGRFKCMRYISLPAMMPTISLLLILAMGSIVSVNYTMLGSMSPGFEALYNFSNPLIISTADVVDVYAYRTGIQKGDYAYSAAVGLTVSAMCFLLVCIANSLAKKFRGEGIF